MKNNFATFIGLFNVHYSQKQIFIDNYCYSNKIFYYLTFLYEKHLISGLAFYKINNKLYYRLYFKYTQQKKLLFKKIKFETRQLPFSLQHIKKYKQIFGLNFFPLIILITKSGFLDIFMADKLIQNGQIHTYILS